MAYTITQKFISQNRSYAVLNAIGTVLHETADPGATDENEFNYFNSGYRGASAHAFVDFDSITQTVPWNEQAWHAGSTANSSFIGIELCHYDDAARFQQVWDRAVWLFAWLHVNVIKNTAINMNTLMSHAEVSEKWHETDHMDPISYFAQFGKSVDDFRNAVQQEVNKMLNGSASITYSAHVQNVGWQAPVKDGAVAGTEGKGLRMEAIAISYDGPGNIIIDGHVQYVGWQAPRNNGEVIGTIGRSLRLEAIKIRLENTPGYHVEYQAHVQNIGWQPWVRDGAVAGTTGQGLRLEAVKIRIVRD